MKRLWQHCHAATLKGGKYSIVEDAALVTDGPLIHWIGPRAELPPGDYAERIDLDGAWLTPGLIDCHTHAVFGGNRSGEFEQRLEGVSAPRTSTSAPSATGRPRACDWRRASVAWASGACAEKPGKRRRSLPLALVRLAAIAQDAPSPCDERPHDRRHPLPDRIRQDRRDRLRLRRRRGAGPERRDRQPAPVQAGTEPGPCAALPQQPQAVADPGRHAVAGHRPLHAGTLREGLHRVPPARRLDPQQPAHLDARGVRQRRLHPSPGSLHRGASRPRPRHRLRRQPPRHHRRRHRHRLPHRRPAGQSVRACSGSARRCPRRRCARLSPRPASATCCSASALPAWCSRRRGYPDWRWSTVPASCM